MPAGIPTDLVLNMRNQGLSNNQIIQSLQRSAFNPQQIADAMAQADIKYNIESIPVRRMQDAAPAQFGAPAGGEGYADTSNYPAYGDETGGAQQTPATLVTETGFSVEALQQLIEQIIEEKWEDLVKDVARIADWKEKMDARITTLETQITELKSSFDKLHTAILEKIGDYDKTITGVGTDIKALESVFKKILPGFMESVGDLSRITDEMKKAKR